MDKSHQFFRVAWLQALSNFDALIHSNVAELFGDDRQVSDEIAQSIESASVGSAGATLKREMVKYDDDKEVGRIVQRALAALDSPQAAWRNHSEAGVRFRMNRYLLADLDETGVCLTLGAAARCHVVRWIVAETRKMSNNTFWYEVLNREKGELSFPLGLGSPVRKRSFYKGMPRRDMLAIQHFVNKMIRLPRGLERLTLAEIFEKPFVGEDAIDRYREFLCDEEPRGQPFDPDNTLQMSDDDDEDPRKLLVEDVMSKIRVSDSPRMVLNVHARGLWRGLTAFGGELAKVVEATLQNENDQRRCLYLPLRNTQVNVAGQHPTIPNYFKLLGILRQFYCGKLHNIQDAEPVPEDADLFKVLDEIRVGMTRRARILILDGVHFPDVGEEVGTSLERVISDDTAFGLLLDLFDIPLAPIDVEPCENSAGTRRRMETFRDNRIVLLSNRPIDPRHDLPAPHKDLRHLDFLLTEPHSSRAEAVLRGHGFSNIERLLDLKERDYELFSSWADSEYFAFDAVLSATRLAGRDDAALMQRIWSLDAGRDRRKPFVRELLQILCDDLGKISPLISKLLFLIALAPDGLRQTTLMRLVLNSVREPQDSGFVSMRDLNLGTDASIESASRAIADTIKLLEKTYPSIVTFRALDAYPGVDNDLAHDLEFGAPRALWHKTVAGAGAPVSIRFNFPEFRSEMRDVLAENFGIEAFRTASALLFEEALAGQTISLRHKDIERAQSINNWRRQFAAVYHGLNSLEIERNGGPPRISKKSASLQYTRSAPQLPRAFYRWLYLFAFRRMVENPPQYSISRRYGQTKLRQVLLSLFSQPWKMLPPTLRQQFDQLQGDLILGEFTTPPPSEAESVTDAKVGTQSAAETVSETEAKKAKVGESPETSPLSVARSYYIATWQANYTLGRIGPMNGALDTLRSDRLRGPGKDNSAWSSNLTELAYAFSVYKRSLDTGILGRKTLAEVHNMCLDGTSPIGWLLRSDQRAELNQRLRSVSAEHAQLVFGASDKGLTNLETSAGWLAKQVWEETNSVEMISRLTDVLNRLAEYHVTEADLAETPDTTEPPGPADFEGIGLFDAPPRITPVTVFARLCFGHTLFLLADALRLHAFTYDPLSSAYSASGHSLRVFARTGLKIQRHGDRLRAARGQPLDDIGAFGMRARHDLNVMTRHHYAFPSERGSQILLESTATRLLSAPQDELASLHVCRKLIARAEPIVMGLGHTSRARLRLSLERGKVHRALARVHHVAKDHSNRDDYLALAELDMHFMRELVLRTHGYELWRSLADAQEKRIAEMKKEFAKGQGHTSRD